MWVVKVPIRRGGDEIVASFKNRISAEETAYQFNFAYDTEIYYFEEVEDAV